MAEACLSWFHYSSERCLFLTALLLLLPLLGGGGVCACMCLSVQRVRDMREGRDGRRK